MKTVFTEMFNKDKGLNMFEHSTHVNMFHHYFHHWARPCALQADGAAAAFPWGYGDHADEKPLQVVTDLVGVE